MRTYFGMARIKERTRTMKINFRPQQRQPSEVLKKMILKMNMMIMVFGMITLKPQRLITITQLPQFPQ